VRESYETNMFEERAGSLRPVRAGELYWKNSFIFAV
jgi:hypothetical protein